MNKKLNNEFFILDLHLNKFIDHHQRFLYTLYIVGCSFDQVAHYLFAHVLFEVLHVAFAPIQVSHCTKLAASQSG